MKLKLLNFNKNKGLSNIVIITKMLYGYKLGNSHEVNSIYGQFREMTRILYELYLLNDEDEIKIT